MNAMPPVEATLVTPIPAGAPPRPDHARLGSPSRSWTYVDAQGEPLVVICRFDRPAREGAAKPGKEILPLSLWRQPDGTLEWRWKGLEAPRPLYNLHRIAATQESDAWIVITEGEKAAEEAADLFPDGVATTPMNGANAAAQTDWAPLRGRNCLIVPDLDEPGRKFAETVAARLREAGAARIRILDLSEIARISWQGDREQHRSPDAVPQGYDLADAAADGWTAERLQAALAASRHLLQEIELSAAEPAVSPLPAVPSGLPQATFILDEDGVWKVVQTYDKKAKETVEELVWVCGPLRIVGYSRDPQTRDWGRLVAFEDPDGHPKRLVIPAQSLAGGGTEVFKRLMSHGLTFVPTRKSCELLMEYLLVSTPDLRITQTRMPGWVGETFALPGISFGPDEVICDLGEIDHRYAVSGCIETWRKTAALAIGNSRLAFALSAAFAGPLLRPLGQEAGGVHFVGSMGDGKTTLAEMAGSVWGGGRAGYIRSWQGSESGHEGAAVATNDTLLVLDEIGQADPALLGPIVYMHHNGSGKNRADTDGRLKDSTSWKCLLLSTGEKTVAQAIADSPRGGRAMAGHAVRLLDIPSDAGAGLGVFEELHGFESSRELALHLHHMGGQHYGHAARAFLTRLTDEPDEASNLVGPLIKEFVAQACPPGASRQVQRAAARFGLIAGAGELAISFGVLPWPTGEALRAADRCFRDWLASQANPEHSREHVEAIRTVQRFISLHGAARFEEIRPRKAEHDPEAFERPVSNRAGYRKPVAEGVEYNVLPEVWRGEICKGLDPEKVARILQQSGLLEPGEAGRLQKKVRLPDHAQPVRCYVLKPGILSWPGTDEDDTGDPEQE
uniref:DUF927 domain-containing protein n=1 Tax=Cereibacter sphaeroides (strain ATCC 17025 / ATH 2.4.3) TaxID=349102 RepID=A4X0A0_CERS5